VRLLGTLLGVSVTASTARETRSAVAATAPAAVPASAVVLDVFRMATPAAATVSAVAATAPTAFVVHLVGSVSAMAHARFLAAVPPLALIAATLFMQSALALSMRDLSVVGASSVSAHPTAPVLPGSFVILTSVWWRALRGSTCQGLGVI
jgi:hypothetical protein